MNNLPVEVAYRKKINKLYEENDNLKKELQESKYKDTMLLGEIVIRLSECQRKLKIAVDALEEIKTNKGRPGNCTSVAIALAFSIGEATTALREIEQIKKQRGL